MDRNPISDLEAVAAMPGLDDFADVLAGFVPARNGSAADPASTLVFLAGRWAFGSANSCDSALRSTVLWELIRASAARAGRVLPKKPPTFNKLHHLRRAADDGAAEALAAALPELTVTLARQVGLVVPGPSRWDRPDASRVIYGDGSVFSPLSDVSVDEDGVVRGSRAEHRPRVASRFEGKDGRAAGSGLPINVVGCHGRRRWQRVILGVDLFRDGNEVGSALDLMRRVIDAAAGGVTHTVYDRLMSGRHMRELMLAGVVPFVAMPEAAPNRAHLVLPAELRRDGYRSAGTREKRKGKGARRRSGDDVAPKARLALYYLRTVEHLTGTGRCAHDLWALDGAVVAVDAGHEVSLDATYLDCRDLRWERHSDGTHPVGRFVIPCRHGAVSTDIDFAATRPGKARNGRQLALADWVRPIPEAATGAARIEGLRSDNESVFSWLKAMLPRNRASSLDPQHFLLDVIGAVLLCNAIAWDVHAAHHTTCAQHEARLTQRRQLRSAT
ncbi:hypothetical protein [Rhabdothermincola sp.]|uniref:hypothetical protein n=1 Tax=Rhabdothermincola sp. TaxID=2820405 RepID=UPI002FE14F1D